MADSWHPASWRSRRALQQPAYPDDAAVDDVLGQLRRRPPLVTSWEVDRLRHQLAEAAAGRRFLLQGGDCAERFDEVRPEIITARLKILMQMSLVLVHGLDLPIVRVGRFAGQYAKPRSSDHETVDGVTLQSFRGDIVNGPEADEGVRLPDPQRMVDAYAYSAQTLNFVRALMDGGFADLHHPEYWDVGFVRQPALRTEYQLIVDSILDALRFWETVTSGSPSELERVDFFTSHEALLLPYEEAMTRAVPRRPGIYNLSTHFPWIGMRTAEPEGAHVEYARGIANPVALKVGPDIQPSALRALVRALDPNQEPGRLTLITRFGVNRIEDCLPPLVEAVRAEGRTPLWSCDPMHGNTETLGGGVKTRRFENILGELQHAFDIHDACGSTLGGVHFELTGENVTECIGGASGLAETDLGRAYISQVDPRLNVEQALEMAFSIVKRRRRYGRPRAGP
jgi:3-deoxy-7-phosphoheptulonate synthase